MSSCSLCAAYHSMRAGPFRRLDNLVPRPPTLTLPSQQLISGVREEWSFALGHSKAGNWRGSPQQSQPESQADPSAEQSPGQSLSTRLPELWTQPDKTPLGGLWGNPYLRCMFWHSWERDRTAQVKTQSSPQCLAFRRCVTELSVQVRLSLLHQGGET